MKKDYLSISPSQTKILGEKFARAIQKKTPGKSALVLALKGKLGAGKTSFLQGFAKSLGVKEKILSPTFVLMKKFELSKKRELSFRYFYHIDCYRIKNEKDILSVGIKEILKNPLNIAAIEWPERIKSALPKNIIEIQISFHNALGKNRIISIKDNFSK